MIKLIMLISIVTLLGCGREEEQDLGDATPEVPVASVPPSSPPPNSVTPTGVPVEVVEDYQDLSVQVDEDYCNRF